MSENIHSTVIPMVVETTGRGERGYDIFSLLLKQRIVFLGTPIDDNVANLIVAELLYLDHEDPGKEISLYVNSPGGSISSGLAIYDTMQLIGSPVSTIAVGMTASMGTILLCAGTKVAAMPCPMPRYTFTSPGEECRARLRTSRSRPAASCVSASDSIISCPKGLASPWSASSRILIATTG